jgi:UPF0755 protein
VKKKLLLCGLVLLLSTGFSVWYLHHLLIAPGPQPPFPVTVLIPQGATLRTSVHILASEGVLVNGWVLSWWARLTGADRKIKSGEYEFTEPISPLEL